MVAIWRGDIRRQHGASQRATATWLSHSLSSCCMRASIAYFFLSDCSASRAHRSTILPSSTLLYCSVYSVHYCYRMHVAMCSHVLTLLTRLLQHFTLVSLSFFSLHLRHCMCILCLYVHVCVCHSNNKPSQRGESERVRDKLAGRNERMPTKFSIAHIASYLE